MQRLNEEYLLKDFQANSVQKKSSSVTTSTMRISRSVKKGDELFYIPGSEYLAILRPQRYRPSAANTWPQGYENQIHDSQSRPSKNIYHSWVCIKMGQYLNRGNHKLQQWERVPLASIYLQ
jgi:hypothetical protein